MGKKRLRKKYTSKGLVGRKSGIFKDIRSDVSLLDKMYNLRLSWEKGQNPWITIANPSTQETNKPFIRVRTESLWGNPKDRQFFEIISKKPRNETDAADLY